LEGFVAIDPDIYFFVDSMEIEAVTNDERNRIILFEQVIIRF